MARPITRAAAGSGVTPSVASFLMPYTAGSIAAIDRSTLVRSMRLYSGLRDSRTSRGARVRINTMTGRLIRNTEPQKKCSRSQPPRIGPSAAPPEKPEPQMAMARSRCRASRKMLRTSDKVEGIRVAPATPSRARAMMSTSGVGANAAISEAVPNAAEPPMSRRRLPTRSPSEPMVISRPARMRP